jgi:hypothetical protein
MPRGGRRNRGPATGDPVVGRVTVLPASGYDGEVPEFPFDDVTVRELEVWHWAWRTPQAAAWAMERWRWRTVALWCRWSTRMEDPEASAALGNVVIRFADQIGLTPAGLAENGWRVAEREAPLAEHAQEAASRARSRFRLVPPPPQPEQLEEPEQPEEPAEGG